MGTPLGRHWDATSKTYVKRRRRPAGFRPPVRTSVLRHRRLQSIWHYGFFRNCRSRKCHLTVPATVCQKCPLTASRHLITHVTVMLEAVLRHIRPFFLHLFTVSAQIPFLVLRVPNLCLIGHYALRLVTTCINVVYVLAGSGVPCTLRVPVVRCLLIACHAQLIRVSLLYIKLQRGLIQSNLYAPEAESSKMTALYVKYQDEFTHQITEVTDMVSNSHGPPRKRVRYQHPPSHSSIALPLSPGHPKSSMLIDGRSESPLAAKIHVRCPKPAKQGPRTSYAQHPAITAD